MGKLYVVATPIGNLKDITLRALEVLREVNFIACEDTRRTLILLNHYNIKDKKLISYYEPKESVQVPKVLKLLEKEDVALVSDAGMPSISDPGYRLIKACVEKGIPVEVIPGPSAVLTALVGSGLPSYYKKVLWVRLVYQFLVGYTYRLKGRDFYTPLPSLCKKFFYQSIGLVFKEIPNLLGYTKIVCKTKHTSQILKKAFLK